MTQIGGLSDQEQEAVESILTETLGTDDLSEVTNVYSVENGEADTVVAVAENTEGETQSIVVMDEHGAEDLVVNNGLFETEISADGGSVVSTVMDEMADTAALAEALTDIFGDGTAAEAAIDAIVASLEVTDRDENINGQITEIESLAGSSENEVVLDFTANTGVVQTLAMDESARVVVEGASAVIVEGAGEVTIGDLAPAILVGDDADQLFIGGAGADTMIGGAGSDTIMGGEGDTIGFVANGHTLIDGFQGLFEGSESGETPADEVPRFFFDVPNVSNIDELNANITMVEGMETWGTADEYTTYHFADGSTVTLTGVQADDILAEMVVFEL
jgi:Ca2+-binding RTX toxin-like protein